MASKKSNIPKSETFEDNTAFLTGLVVFIINSILVYAVLSYASSGVPNHHEWKQCTFELLPAVLAFLINSWISYYVYNQVKIENAQDKPVIDNVINFYKNPKHLLAVGLIIAIAAYVSFSCANKQLHMNQSLMSSTRTGINEKTVLAGGGRGVSLNDISDGPIFYKNM